MAVLSMRGLAGSPRCALLLVWLLTGAPAAHAQTVDTPPLPRLLPTPMGEPLPATTALLERLRRGGMVLLVRHERTDLDSRFDLTPYAPDSCELQRNLSLAGHASAVAMRQGLRELRIPVGQVIASPYCRTLATALALDGGARRDARLIGPDPRMDRTEAQVLADLIAVIAEKGRAGANLVLVGHHGNFMPLTGEWLDEGEALVLDPRGPAAPVPLARFTGARLDELVREYQRDEATRAAGERPALPAALCAPVQSRCGTARFFR